MNDPTPAPSADRAIHRWSCVWVSLICLAFAAVLGRVVQLKTTEHPRLEAAAGSAFSTRPEMARRGDLVDRRGRKIATSLVGYRLFVDPAMVDDARTIAPRIAHLIGGDAAEFHRRIVERPDSRYVVLDHLLEDWQVEAIRTANLPGVGLDARLVRTYPNEELAALVVGKVGFEHTGQGAAEHRFEERLRPEHGRVSFLRDARGRAMWVEREDYVPAEDGETVRLSIDLVIQEIAERHLRDAIERYNAGGGRLVVLDVTTGEILAMCDVLRPRPDWDEITTDPGREVHPGLGRNRCATDPFEPGSSFKPFVWAAATELGVVSPEEILETPSEGPHRTSRGRRIRDVKYLGPVSWETVLVRSMNSGMAIVGERMTERQLREAVRRFGFGRETGSRIPGESGGIVTPAERWNHYSQTSVPMGQEIAVTVLQMVRAFSAFARDGSMVDLRLTATEDDGASVDFVRRAISPEAAATTRAALRKVMTEGTGQRAQSDLYDLFGKSGTPQLPKKEGGGYHERRYMPNFIAGAPYSDPRIVVCCVIDDPDRSKGHYGGVVAGPVVRDVIDETLTYLGVPPEKAAPADGPGGPGVLARDEDVAE